MRIGRSLILMGLGLACRPPSATVDAPGPSDEIGAASAPLTPIDEPSGLDALPMYVERLRDASERVQALGDLEQLILATEPDAERTRIVEALVPALVEIWDDAAAERSRMLRLCLLLEHPDASPVWNRAVGIDGSAAGYHHTLLALDGIRRARATGSVRPVIAALEHLIAHPELDAGEHEGEVRATMAELLGIVGDRRATPVLVDLLEQSAEQQPVLVHRRAAEALGRIGDPAAARALLAVAYRVPDAAITTSIGERAKIALAAIGEPAVAPALEMLNGENEELRRLIQQHRISQANTTVAAAMILGIIGSASAVDALIEQMPTADCKGRGRGRRPSADAPEVLADIQIRAMIAYALGLIGDRRAVPSLCRCATASNNPGDMFYIAEALGRIGGPKATACLARVIATGVYDEDAVSSPEFEREIRWEAARFGILAAGPEALPKIEAAIERASRRPEVAKHMPQWDASAEVLRRCKRDVGCFGKTLDDPDADRFAREVAAINLARLAPGNAAVAERIAAAYEVRDPDVRVTMAWLCGHMMQGQRCSACARTLARILAGEKDSRPPKEYQLSVLTARYAIAKLREPGG